MSFNKFINKKEIKKVIDPGIGDLPNNTDKPLPKIPEYQDQVRDIQSTLIKLTISDLATEAANLQVQIRNTIDDIVQANKSDAGFTKYHQLVAENHFNPVVLLTDSKAKPPITVESNAIKIAERDVYRRVNDTRAPFIQDLYSLLADAGLSEYVLKEQWAKIANPNKFYDSFNEKDEFVRFALEKERQHLALIKESTERIHRNTVERLSYGFMKAMALKITNEVHLTTPREQIQQIDNVIKMLNNIKAILTISVIINTENWERFVSNLKGIYGDILQITATKSIKTTAYAIVAGIKDKVMEFVEGMESIIPFELDIEEIPEMRELLDQVYSTLGVQLSKVEDDLISREATYSKLEENRQLLYLNSRKNSKTKQYLELLDKVTHYLNQIKQTLQSLNESFILDTEKLLQTMITGADDYIRSIATKPSDASTSSPIPDPVE